MANTWRVNAESVAITNGKDLLDLWNAAGARVYRVFRIWCFNQSATVTTGVLGYAGVYRTSACTVASGTARTAYIISHSTSNSSLDAGLTAGTGRTLTTSSSFRRVAISPDEAAPLVLGWDEITTVVPFAQIWGAGYGSASVEPLAIRASQSEGLCVWATTSTAGTLDIEMEFTDAAS